jgi:hypothetical protein
MIYLLLGTAIGLTIAIAVAWPYREQIRAGWADLLGVEHQDRRPEIRANQDGSEEHGLLGARWPVLFMSLSALLVLVVGIAIELVPAIVAGAVLGVAAAVNGVVRSGSRRG